MNLIFSTFKVTTNYFSTFTQTNTLVGEKRVEKGASY